MGRKREKIRSSESSPSVMVKGVEIPKKVAGIDMSGEVPKDFGIVDYVDSKIDQWAQKENLILPKVQGFSGRVDELIEELEAKEEEERTMTENQAISNLKTLKGILQNINDETRRRWQYHSKGVETHVKSFVSEKLVTHGQNLLWGTENILDEEMIESAGILTYCSTKPDDFFEKMDLVLKGTDGTQFGVDIASRVTSFSRDDQEKVNSGEKRSYEAYGDENVGKKIGSFKNLILKRRYPKAPDYDDYFGTRPKELPKFIVPISLEDQQEYSEILRMQQDQEKDKLPDQKIQQLKIKMIKMGLRIEGRHRGHAAFQLKWHKDGVRGDKNKNDKYKKLLDDWFKNSDRRLEILEIQLKEIEQDRSQEFESIDEISKELSFKTRVNDLQKIYFKYEEFIANLDDEVVAKKALQRFTTNIFKSKNEEDLAQAIEIFKKSCFEGSDLFSEDIEEQLKIVNRLKRVSGSKFVNAYQGMKKSEKSQYDYFYRILDNNY